MTDFIKNKYIKLNSKIKLLVFISIALMLIVLTIVILLFNGIIWFNNPSQKHYPVRGIDVSSYQGEIDWGILSKQGVTYAFIKATEGSTYQDEKFQYNWSEANKTDLKIGAYHFFSYDSSGKSQAENFINTVPVSINILPPVVDIEFYGDKNKNLPNKAETTKNLDELLLRLEQHYNKKPIIYATMKSYNLYIKDTYTDYPIWIRDVIRKPKLQPNLSWTFWQYSNRAKLDGYTGKETFIDMNVFNGTQNEFESMFYNNNPN